MHAPFSSYPVCISGAHKMFMFSQEILTIYFKSLSSYFLCYFWVSFSVCLFRSLAFKIRIKKMSGDPWLSFSIEIWSSKKLIGSFVCIIGFTAGRSGSKPKNILSFCLGHSYAVLYIENFSQFSCFQCLVPSVPCLVPVVFKTLSRSME